MKLLSSSPGHGNPAATASALALLFFLCPCRLQPRGQENPQALKVLQLIAKIERDNILESGATLRREVVSESELNAYIAQRIESEQEKIMKELELKLDDKNRIEGRVLIDLSGLKIPVGFHSRMHLYFSGTIQTKEQKVRLEMESLFLEQQKIQPAFLDMIVSLVSRFEKTEPVGIQGWHDLPYGIKRLETRSGELIVFY